MPKRDASVVTPAPSYASRAMGTGAADLEAYRALFDATLDAFEIDYLRWLYCDCPLGPPVGFNAYAGDELAAHYSTIPVAATFDGFFQVQSALGLVEVRPATGAGIFAGHYRTRAAQRVAADGFVARRVERVIRQIVLCHVRVNLIVIPRQQR